MSTDESKEYVLRMAKEQDVKFIRLWFSDILGNLKSVAITVEELEEALEEGIGFDGSSIEGFARIDESDMLAKPDPATFTFLPQEKPGYAAGRMFCDILWPGGEPFDGDPRYILKMNLKRAKDMGYTTFNVGPELEYFYFKSAEIPQQLDAGGYFDLTPPDIADDLRQETVLALENMGINVEYSHHEVAYSQHEIDMRYTDALTMADNVMTYRLVVKEVALQHGVYATFMPKPVFGWNGSGMHTHQSLFKGDRNAFFDKDDEYHLSKIAKCYIAGLLKHAPEITAVTSQWVNSYKRLVPGTEAPMYVTWSPQNPSDLVRVPAYKPGFEQSTRVEYRVPDAAANPYLAFAAVLAAGLDGIENERPLPPPVEENVFEIAPEERIRRGIETLPGSLAEAIEVAESSPFLRNVLGDHVFESLVANKRIEWDRYRVHVTRYELDKYLPVL